MLRKQQKEEQQRREQEAAAASMGLYAALNEAEKLHN